MNELQARTAKIKTLCAINDIPFPDAEAPETLHTLFFDILDLTPAHPRPHDLRTILGELDQVLDLLDHDAKNDENNDDNWDPDDHDADDDIMMHLYR